MILNIKYLIPFLKQIHVKSKLSNFPNPVLNELCKNVEFVFLFVCSPARCKLPILYFYSPTDPEYTPINVYYTLQVWDPEIRIVDLLLMSLVFVLPLTIGIYFYF